MVNDVKKGETVVLAGTKKGLFLFHSRDRRRWKCRGPFFAGVSVYHATFDPRDGKSVWAGVTSEHWGPSVQRSTSFGARWTRGSEGPRFPKASGLSVDRVWHIACGQADGELWAGVEPAGLFHSVDNGKTWTSVDGLNLRKEREAWMPGGGGLCLHTILPHPRDPERMIVGISAVGVMGTEDGGRSWRLMNGGVRADYLPEKRTREDQAGSCPHKIVRDARDPDVLYMQNHCGVFRRRANESAWTDVSRGLPSRFGFPMAAHPHDVGSVYVVPLTGDYNRVTPDGAMAVYRTTTAGKRWERLGKGLPQKDAFFTILRDGLATDTHDPAGVYVGTTTGRLYASRDEGATWSAIAESLPPILSVEAGIVGA